MDTMILTTDNKFTGEIKVASRIIDILSSGLYHTPAACLKELVNNAYDARATVVNVFVKPDADRIIIEDNGDGMSKEGFVAHFDRISESHKRDESGITVGSAPMGGRPKIGKIGIGFIAANELCEILEIFSTKEGSEELLHVTIDFKQMREPIAERRRNESDIVKADYVGDVTLTDKESHYTKIFLTEVRGPAREILAGSSNQSDDKVRSLYGLKSESIFKVLRDGKINNWKEFDDYSETMLSIALNVPVGYHSGWMPQGFEGKVRRFEEEVAKLGFSVLYDGSELKKPIVFSHPSDSILVRQFDFTGEHVCAKGYFYAQHGTIKPNDLHGLLVRIRNAAVGEYDHSFWGFSPSDAPLIQRWVSAEIWADDRLEEAMNIDRRTLRVAHPAYVELKREIHKSLRSVLNDARKELYETSSAARNEGKTESTKESIRQLATQLISPISSNAASDLERAVDRSSSNKVLQKALEHKFSLMELFETVIDSAKDVLGPEELEKFVSHLTKRITR